MSSLTTLKNKAPKEVLGLLSAVSNTLLPNPWEEKKVIESKITAKLVDSILEEIRKELRIPSDDFSIQSRSKIYEFLSKEISDIALQGTNLNKIKMRLGDKGELRPDQYEVEFPHIALDVLRAFGEKESNIINAVLNPDNFQHIGAKYVNRENAIGLTISMKNVFQIKDKFSLLVVSGRSGNIQHYACAFRLYKSDFDFDEKDHPFEILKKFINIYGLTFSIGNKESKFFYNEIINVHSTELMPIHQQMEVLDGYRGDFFLPFIFGNSSNLASSENEEMGEILLAFALNIPKYVTILRKHNVQLSPESNWQFPRIGFPDDLTTIPYFDENLIS